MVLIIWQCRAPAPRPDARPPEQLPFPGTPAPWRSGYAAACKAVHTGSIPVGASAGVGCAPRRRPPTLQTVVSLSVAFGLLLALCCAVVALLGFLFKQRGAVH